MVDKDAPVTTLANNPEIQKLIADAVAKQVHEFAKSAGASMPGDDKRFASDLAEAIAVMANQGAGGRPKPVSPELMAARAEGAKKLALILAEVDKNLRKAQYDGNDDAMETWLPQYRVAGKIYLNEVVLEPFTAPKRKGDSPVPTVVYWSGPPNHSMIPANAIAKRVKEAFLESVGGSSPMLSAISGPNGGQVAPDNRGYWMTFNGKIVKGAAPTKALTLETAIDPLEHPISPRDPNPAAPFVHVLGTIHPKTRQQGIGWDNEHRAHREAVAQP